jgi:hypothetical protein
MLRKNENGQQPWPPAVLGLLNQRLRRLPVSATAAAVETASASTVEASATTVEASASTVEATARGSVEPATTVEAVTTTKATAEATTTCKSTTTHESPPADEPTTEAEAAAETPASPRATPAPPGAGADEHSTREPIRPIVAVGRASVGRVAVVAIFARRRPPHIARAKPHAHTHLRL